MLLRITGAAQQACVIELYFLGLEWASLLCFQ